MDPFHSLLESLGSLIGVPLHPDHGQKCRLNINHQTFVQLEDETHKNRILIAAFICDIPLGKFRELVLKEALKENNLYPRVATFSYCEKNNKLSLFMYAYYTELNGEKLADILATFLEKLFNWKTGIETGHLPQRSPTEASGSAAPSIFTIQ